MDRFTMCMDRINWKHGSKNVNYLVVSFAWQGSSIPIVWVCLDKKVATSKTTGIFILKQILIQPFG
ncbi:MAG: hypothetical protein QS721_08395 [Candidatus Endonucleobacter sp. (ex Gigantidas childressi)]|nr:hypothetical protein [Candidatus Endonucleobacter sp. (ex Gigantidas childressi)]